jgi:hypothetical protein
MEAFQNFEIKSIQDAPQGACVAFSKDGGVCVGIVSQPIQSEEAATVAVVWTSLSAHPRLPGIVDRDFFPVDQGLAFPTAKAVLPHDLAHVHLGYSEAAPLGALCVADGEPYVVARSDAECLVMIKLRDGARRRNDWPKNAPWFSSWSIASPDIDGRWRTICTIECKGKQQEAPPPVRP